LFIAAAGAANAKAPGKAQPAPKAPAPASAPTPVEAAPAPAPAPAAVTVAPAAPSPAAPPSNGKPRLVVLDLAVAGGVEPQMASALTEAVAAEVASKGYFEVMASKDVQTMLGLERQRQMLGCSDEAGSCLTELAGALGARFVLSGTVAKLGEAFQFSLQTLDSRKAQPIGRAVRIAKSLEVLRAQMPYAVAEATGTPVPPPPSRLLPYSLIGVGGAAILGGGVWGLQALSSETALTKELQLGDAQRSVLKPVTYYQDARDRISQDKTVSLVAMAAGAALLGVGVYLNPAESGSGAHAALVPTGTGVALVGGWQ
jgi:TolB-like protein